MHISIDILKLSDYMADMEFYILDIHWFVCRPLFCPRVHEINMCFLMCI